MSDARIGLLVAGIVVFCAAVTLAIFRRSISAFIADNVRTLWGPLARDMTASPRRVAYVALGWAAFGVIAITLALALPNYHPRP